MGIILNAEQAKGLANFFFDVAKGLTVGALGLAAVIRPEIKAITVLGSIIGAFICIQFALALLENTT